jgi:hypothetical protein
MAKTIRTIPAKGPSIFISADYDIKKFESLLAPKTYVKFEDIINGELGIHYVFARLNEDVDAIVNQYMEIKK